MEEKGGIIREKETRGTGMKRGMEEKDEFIKGGGKEEKGRERERERKRSQRETNEDDHHYSVRERERER